MATKNTPQFTIGQKVKAISFTDCFDKFVPETPNLTITEIRLIEPSTMSPYFRVKAEHSDGFQFIEGAERYFAAEMAYSKSVTPALIGTGVVLALAVALLALAHFGNITTIPMGLN